MSQSRKITKLRTVCVLFAALLGGSLLGAGTASAAEPNAGPPPNSCGSGEICLWAYNDMPGEPTLRWTPDHGLLNLPPDLHDNVRSFVANANGCFIDTNPREKHVVRVGDYRRAYTHDGNFGSRVDQVAPSC